MTHERITSEVKVRFAPSPTGVPHVGNIRTALYDYFYARSNNGTFVLRIEDTDRARKVEGAEEAIKDSLSWLGADWDEYVVQSERLETYKKYAQELVSKGLAKEEDGAVRFIVPDEGKISWTDKVGNRLIEFENEKIEDFIILKSDGFPTYHLANVVDDHLMGITHVIRGEDWIPSTPMHLLLYKAFGWESPIFAHVPNVLGVDRQKLSKRKGAKSVLDYRTEGYISEALLNYLMLLGWSPKDDREILSKEDIVQEFSLDKVNVAPAIFDETKLRWMNAEYIRRFDNAALLARLYEFDAGLRDYDSELVAKLVEPAKSRMKTLADFITLIEPFVVQNKVQGKSEIKKDLYDGLSSLENWNNDEIYGVLRKLMEEKKLRLQDLYAGLIGEKQGLPLSATFEILGREKTLALLS